MKYQKNNLFTIFALPLLAISTQVSADYKADIGYTALKAELGAAIPGGSGVKVTQVEASPPNTDPNILYFAPDPSAGSMTGKTFSYPGLTCSTPPCTPNVFSGHAMGVADRFYGNSLSIANGISNIHSYEVNQWINTLYKNDGSASTSDRRIANHSWAGTADNQTTSAILKFVDRQVELNEYIQVAAATGSPLIGNAYNTISVGLTNGSSLSSAAVDTTYIAGRAITDIVAPASAVSNATPIVSAAAALLVETGHQQPSLSLGSRTVTSAGTIYNAERSETVKAILMAGADRETSNTSGYGNITDYRSAGNQTDNGLDKRYGAGQVNIYNSYQIMTAGEQNSLQEGGSNNGQIGMVGFDYYDFNHTNTSSNTIASYSFTANTDETLSAALVWNLGVSNDGAITTTLPNLGLSLLDVTNNLMVAISESMLDNSQNLFWQSLIGGHDYQIQVSSLEGAVNWDYALAWNRTINAAPVPLPAAFWLFGSALVSLIGFQLKRNLA